MEFQPFCSDIFTYCQFLQTCLLKFLSFTNHLEISYLSIYNETDFIKKKTIFIVYKIFYSLQDVKLNISFFHTVVQFNINLPKSKERVVHVLSAQSTLYTRGKNSQHVMNAWRILSDSAVNRQVDLSKNAVTRRGASVQNASVTVRTPCHLHF